MQLWQKLSARKVSHFLTTWPNLWMACTQQRMVHSMLAKPPRFQNTTALALISYIDPQLLNESIEEARISDVEMDHEVPQVIHVHHSISNPLTTI